MASLSPGGKGALGGSRGECRGERGRPRIPESRGPYWARFSALEGNLSECGCLKSVRFGMYLGFTKLLL